MKKWLNNIKQQQNLINTTLDRATLFTQSKHIEANNACVINITKSGQNGWVSFAGDLAEINMKGTRKRLGVYGSSQYQDKFTYKQNDSFSTPNTSSNCASLFSVGSTTRMAAGGPLTDDVIKCQLKPVSAKDYAPLQLTSNQVDQLTQAFPDGVCDYTKSSIGYQENPTEGWGSFGSKAGQPFKRLQWRVGRSS